jgi:hypothetical protein
MPSIMFTLAVFLTPDKINYQLHYNLPIPRSENNPERQAYSHKKSSMG